MATPREPPLDEIQWKSPEFVQRVGGIHTNTILPYFSESPFFDATSNNASLSTQALYNSNMYYILQTREAFEGRLKTMQGLEFMIAHDPSENDTKPDNGGVWVIRKQNRKKRQGMQDEVTGISCYFVVNDNIYMAPSVGSVLEGRLLSTVTSLTKLLSTASTLSKFTPTSGHTYLSPTSKNPTLGSSFQTTQTSKEGTPMPGGTPKQETQDSVTTKTSLSSKFSVNTDYQGIRILADSWDLSLRYGNEYMDENPIIGEPGSFRLSQARDSTITSSMSSTNSVSQPFRATANKAPLQVKTDMTPEPTKKGSTGTGKSPTTPFTKEKKARRKSKAAGATTPKVSTPRTTTPKTPK